jgi:hypothetical protein
MKVFITGATGVLGHRFVERLSDRGHEVIGLSDISTGQPSRHLTPKTYSARLLRHTILMSVSFGVGSSMRRIPHIRANSRRTCYRAQCPSSVVGCLDDRTLKEFTCWRISLMEYILSRASLLQMAI